MVSKGLKEDEVHELVPFLHLMLQKTRSGCSRLKRISTMPSRGFFKTASKDYANTIQYDTSDTFSALARETQHERVRHK